MKPVSSVTNTKYAAVLFLLALSLLLSACTWMPSVDDTLIGGSETSSQESPSTGEIGRADPSIPHTDADDDGLCDDCLLSVVVNIDFFTINDLHGKICDSDSQPGVDELTGYLKNAYATEEAVILLSSGDMWQGSSESNLTKGMLMTEWMNELDFVAMTIGNHEFDWGESYMAQNAELATFPLLAINIFDRETDEPVEYCQSSVMVERGGVQIGIIGAIGDCYSSISGEMSGGVYFKVGRELTELVKAESTRLREAGADFIVYSLHDGYGDSRHGGILTDSQMSSYYDASLSNGYVDLVFEAHTHQRYALEDSEGVYHLQNGGENRGIAHVEVNVNFANGKSRVETSEIISSSTYETSTPDPIVQQLMEKYKDQVSQGTEILGQNAKRRSGDELRNLVAELYYRTGEAAFGGEYDIVLGGGFISVRNPYELAAGDVSYSDLQSLFPFDNTLVLCSIRGSDLKRRFVETDNSNYFNYYGAYGQSVIGNIDPDGTYYVVVDTYTSTYAPNRLTEIERYEEGVYARDLLADYIRKGGFN